MLLPRIITKLVGWAVSVFYDVERTGPSLADGPVLVIANHPNALVDHTDAPAWFRALYLRFGERLGGWIEGRAKLRGLVRAAMLPAIRRKVSA